MRDLKIINARIPDYEQDCIREAELLIRDGKIEKIRERGAITEETPETAVIHLRICLILPNA